MSEVRYRVSPRSWDDISRVATKYRSMLGVFDKEQLPVVELVEVVLSQRLELFEFMVGDADEMGDNYGLTDPNGEFMMIREDVYHHACRGQPRAIWTITHEWGHWALHAGRPLARATSTALVRPFECAELQAHQFAAEMLMPRHLIRPDESVETLMSRFRVSRDAASRRMGYLRKRGIIRE